MEPKLRLLLDATHGEQNAIYEELVKLLNERCQVTSLKKKPLNLKQLTENNVFMLTNPEKARMQSRKQLPAFLIGYMVARGFLLVDSKIHLHRPPKEI